ncbi:AraC family transcriptional regulator [Actinoplanes sp. GCM10030250]|uniref:AraC family transcriptional regulator n=1 Tax=Actinoplanes sp. GCM10030250 TaxID=3273376 RepID=UPI00360B9586
MEARRGGTQSYAITVRTGDLAEARAVCGEHLYPRSMRLVEPGSRLDARFAFLQLGAITLGDVRYGAAVAGVTGELGSYHVNVARSGRFFAGQDGRPISGGPGHAAVYRPVGLTELHYASADCHLLALKIDTQALETHLHLAHDVTVRGAIRFTGRLDVDRAPGRTYASLIHFLAGEIGNTDSLCFEPIVAAPLEEALMTALLVSADHQYHDAMRSDVPVRNRSGGIAPAIDAVHAEPRRAYTVAGLAEIAGTTAGRLRAAFRRQFGTTPMTYVREVRLMRAHEELLGADPDRTSITAVAHRWGFTGPGRFTELYRARFHVSPAETLRGDD